MRERGRRGSSALRAAAIAAACFAALATRVAADELPRPETHDGHEAFLAYLRAAESRAFDVLLARYDEHLRAHPHDVVAHVERCRFLSAAQCGEEQGCPHWEEHERCIERLWGEEVVERGESLLAGPAKSWPAADRAAIHARIAAARSSTEQHAAVVEHARRAMALDPALDLSLVAARALRALGRGPEAVELIVSRLDASDAASGVTEKIRRLLELGAHRDAALALDDLERRTGDGESDPLLAARVWLEVGRVQAARRALERAAASPAWSWRAQEIARERFRLEVQYGDVASASGAYEALRDTGFLADPFLRHRLRLALRHPGAPWQPRDALGGLAVLCLVGGVILAPLLLLLPVHYVGLLRARAALGRVPVPTRFGLRHAWWSLAALFLSMLPFSYMEGAPSLEAAVAGFAGGVELVPPSEIPERSLAAGGLAGALITAAGAALVVRRGDLRLVTAGRWSLRRTVLASAAAVLGLRLLLGGWIWLVAGVAPRPALVVEQMVLAMGRAYGLPVLLLVVVVLTPLAEALIFRGTLLDGLRRHLRFGWANLLQATLFASLHEGWGLFPFYLAFAATAGSLARRSGTLLAPTLLHAGNNAIAIAGLARQLGGA